MEKCTEQTTKNGQVVIWTEVEEMGCRLGLLFTPGHRLQLYTHALVYENNEARTKIFCNTKGMAILDNVIRPRLLQYASEHYPKEFQPLPDPKD